jgi:hypothetical protein
VNWVSRDERPNSSICRFSLTLAAVKKTPSPKP